jgi:hypothetical protein
VTPRRNESRVRGREERREGKIFHAHAVKAYRGSRRIALLILQLGARWIRVDKFTSRPLYPQERTPVRIEEEAGWTPESVYTFGDEKTFFLLPGFEPWNIRPGANSTTLTWLINLCFI